MKMRRLLGILAGLLLVLLTRGPALADGFILPHKPEIPLTQSYRIDYHDVTIAVCDGVAEIRVEQAFTNLLDRPLEVSYLFPVPENAVISRFGLVVDGAEMQAQLYEKDEARRIYEAIVRQRRDPALLEYAGRGLFRTSVFPIPPRGSRSVKLRYFQIVESQGDLHRLVYPLATEKYSARPLQRVNVTIDISSTRAINNLYSPSHSLTILDRSDHRQVARYSEQGVVPRTDLTFYYQLASGKTFDAALLAYRPSPAADGYFLLLASPRAELPRGAVQPKTILFVLDRSGSMNGDKLRQAKEALRTILPNLGKQDRFNLVVYNDRVDAFRPAPVPAGTGEIEAALAFVDDVTALGGTDIDSALRRALGQIEREEGRGCYVVFLTDGLPTVGEIKPAQIRENVKAANAKAGARVFVFGVGYDVNTVLLDGLAQANRGLTNYVRPGEDLEVSVAGFFGQIQHPVLTDLELTCQGATLADCLPRQLPDLFHGQQLVIAGRYHGKGRVKLTLSGMAGGKRQEYVYQADLPAADEADKAFVARIWAARKVGYLLDQLRQLPPDSHARQELVDEVIRLAKAYGIATEYTSFLVLEDDAGVLSAKFREAAAAPTSGAGAVGSAAANKGLQRADQVAEAPDFAADRVRTVADKTFYLRDEIWVDAAYTPGDKLTRVGAYTDDYFALAARLGVKAAYLSIAERIILVWEGTAYQIDPPNK